MKFIITCVMPSGAKWAWSRFKDDFALVRCENGSVKNAFAWDTHDDAEGYLLAQMDVAPQLSKMGPFEIEAVELPS